MNPVAKRVAIFGAVTALLVVGSLLCVIGHDPKIKREMHLARVDWLPVEASDISYAQKDGMGWLQSYECSLPRETLDKLAQTEGWKLEAKENISTGLRSTLGLPALREIDGMKVDLVPKALFYEDRKPNGGGVTVIYDLELGRLFVSKSHR